MSLKPGCGQLTEQNFHKWMSTMKSYLTAVSLRKYIATPRLWRPDDTQQPGFNDQNQVNADDLEEYIIGAAKTMWTLKQHTSNKLINIIIEIEDPFEAWASLVTPLLEKYKQNMTAIIQQLLTQQLRPGQSIRVFAGNLKSTIDRVNSLKPGEISKNMETQMLLLSLGTHYSGLMASIYLADDERITWSYVLEKVQVHQNNSEEERKLMLGDLYEDPEDDIKEVAFYSGQQQQNPNNRRNRNRSPYQTVIMVVLIVPLIFIVIVVILILAGKILICCSSVFFLFVKFSGPITCRDARWFVKGK